MDIWPQLGPAKLSPLHKQWAESLSLSQFSPSCPQEFQLVSQGSKSLRWEGAGLRPREQQGWESCGMQQL